MCASLAASIKSFGEKNHDQVSEERGDTARCWFSNNTCPFSAWGILSTLNPCSLKISTAYTYIAFTNLFSHISYTHGSITEITVPFRECSPKAPPLKTSSIAMQCVFNTILHSRQHASTFLRPSVLMLSILPPSPQRVTQQLPTHSPTYLDIAPGKGWWAVQELLSYTWFYNCCRPLLLLLKQALN